MQIKNGKVSALALFFFSKYTEPSFPVQHDIATAFIFVLYCYTRQAQIGSQFYVQEQCLFFHRQSAYILRGLFYGY
jgi:hypothetical protein